MPPSKKAIVQSYDEGRGFMNGDINFLANHTNEVTYNVQKGVNYLLRYTRLGIMKFATLEDAKEYLSEIGAEVMVESANGREYYALVKQEGCCLSLSIFTFNPIYMIITPITIADLKNHPASEYNGRVWNDMITRQMEFAPDTQFYIERDADQPEGRLGFDRFFKVYQMPEEGFKVLGEFRLSELMTSRPFMAVSIAADGKVEVDRLGMRVPNTYEGRKTLAKMTIEDPTLDCNQSTMKIYSLYLSQDGLMHEAATNAKALDMLLVKSGYSLDEIEVFDNIKQQHRTLPYSYANLCLAVRVSSANNSFYARLSVEDKKDRANSIRIQELKIISK
jgi:hypothetical protein